MMHIGEVTAIEGYEILVRIPQREIAKVRCGVLQPSVSSKKVYNFPSVGDQVVCFITKEIKVVIGSLYSDVDVLPEKAEGDSVVLDMSLGKFVLKNNQSDLKDIFGQLLIILKTLKLSTGVGPSGTILPDVLAKVNKLENSINSLIDGVG